MPLAGQMMERPLLVSSILTHAALVHGKQEIVSCDAAGAIHRYTYQDAGKRVARLAHALVGLGVQPGDRVATLAWNNYRHFELYYAISGIGAVCHTVNPRLFREQLVHIFNHAADRFLFVDPAIVPLVEDLSADLGTVEGVVAMAGAADQPDSEKLDLLCYETLIEGQKDTYDWPEFDERTAAALCYTSGTTGNPKGVLYSHRSTVLHALSSIVGHHGRLTRRDTFLPVVPMFHVCAWGYPYVCPMVGAKMVMPGPRLDGANLHQLLEAEQVTVTAGVPTVWYGLMEHLKETGGRLECLQALVSGGAAASLALIRDVESHGVEFIHGWGLTESSPVAATCSTDGNIPYENADARQRAKLKQGSPLFGVEIRIVGRDGKPAPHDGEAAGEVLMRGNAIISGYFNDPDADKDAFDENGWFRTGDIGVMDPDGNIQLTDRTKDLIKSGGEWISSIDLENAALGHPAVAAAAAIAVAHPKWDERPLLVVVPRDGETASADDIREFLKNKVASWWVPDDVVFVEEMPMTATGKVSKRQLREKFDGYKLPTA
jgi:fatty-acyl-CoA synthase